MLADTAVDTLPQAIPHDLDKIPAILKKLKIWVTWQAGQIKPNGKFDKYPVDPVTGRKVSAQDPANWMTFSQASQAYERCKATGSISGIGIALSGEPVANYGNALCGAHQYLVALDFDRCTGQLQSLKALQKSMGIYGEISPSLTGVRMLALSRTPPKGGNAGYGPEQYGRELYSDKRFVTVTGLGGRGEIIDATDALNALAADWFKPKKVPPAGLLSEGNQLGRTKSKPLLAHLNERPETPDQIAYVKSQLTHVDADCTYEQWRSVVWSVLSTGWKCAQEIAEQWSRSAEHRFESNAFDLLVRGFDPSRGITLGTLDHYARQGGWQPERERAASITSALHQDPHPASQQKWLLTPAELRALPQMQWRIHGLLPSTGLASIYGPSGSGKTFLALDMAAAIATASTAKNAVCMAIFQDQSVWYGARVKPAPVVYVALEGEGGIQNRLAAWEKQHNKQVPDSLRFVLGRFTLLHPEHSEELAAEILETIGPNAVVFIDTLNQSAPGTDENASADMGRVITNAKLLASLIDGLVVLIHHAGKDVSRGMRGHSSLFAAMDAVIEVGSTVNGKTWKVAKSKDGVTGNAHGFALVSHNLGQDADGITITSCAIGPDLAGLMGGAAKPLKPLTGKNRIAAMQALKAIASKHPGAIPQAVALQAVIACLPAARRTNRAKELIDGLIDSGHLIQMDEGVCVA